jgi:TonB-linked SusC/RagA family outer membrane protein
MKKVLLLFSMIFFSLVIFAQDVKITIKMENEPIKSILNEIEKKSNYTFVYSSTLIDTRRNISLVADNEKLETVVAKLCTIAGLNYSFEGKRVVLTQKLTNQEPAKGSQKSVQVTGRVLDEQNQPLPGAYVYLKNNGNIRTVSNVDGRFTLSVPEDLVNKDVIAITFVGMKMSETPFAGSADLIVILEVDTRLLEDVVVTGYQTISKERSAGSFSLVKGEVVQDKANISGSLIQSLEGQAAGLNVNIKSNGDEEFLIRGLTSINSNKTPLIVVDGVAVSQSILNNMISNNDISTVTFLKDATAASIWGSRAANGVIVITTKTGSDTNRKVKVSYDGTYTNKGMPDYSYQNMMDPEMFIKTAKETFDPVAWPWDNINAGIYNTEKPQVYRHEKILYDFNRGLITESQMNSELAKLAALNNREQMEEYFMQPAFATTHNVSLTGGSSFYKYFFSLGYENDGSTSKSSTDKFMINSRQEFNLTSWLKADLGINLGMTSVNNQVSPTGGLSTIPYMMFADENGNPLSHSDLNYMDSFRLTKQAAGDINLDYIPLLDANGSFSRSVINNARINAGINIKLFKGLTFDGRYYYQRGNGKSESFLSRDTWDVRNETSYFTQPKVSSTTLPTFYLPTKGGNYDVTNSQSTDWTVRNQFAYQNSFDNSKHQINALAGMELRATRNITSITRSKGYDPQLLTFQPYDEKLLAATGITTPLIRNTTSGNNKLTTPSSQFGETEVRYVSVYSNLGYTYNNRYSLNASFRVDQSNLFGTDKSVQFKPIWSAGLVWNVTNENFMKGQKVFNRLMARFSYGLAGNSPDPGKGGPYNVIRVKTVGNTIFNELGSGFEVEYPANTRLTWEQTRTVNFGVDYSILNNRVSGSIDVYDKYTTNLLANLDLASTSGWNTTYANTGIMSNKGVELSVNSLNVNNSDWRWSTNFTFSYNVNKVVKLYESSTFITVFKPFAEGFSANTLWAYRFAGLDNMGDPLSYNANGDLIKTYAAIDQNIKLGENKTIVNMGVMTPPFYGGVTNNIKFKDFELSFMFIYNLGHKMFNTAATYSGRLTRNLNKEFDNRWRNVGDNTNIPSYVANTSLEARRNTDFFTRGDINVLSASYVKLRDLSISYSLPANICNKLYTDKIKLRLQVSNLLTIAANKYGIDPEAHNLTNGIRYNRFGPSYSIGLSVNFK